MLKKLKLSCMAMLFALNFTGGTLAYSSNPAMADEIESAVIIGSAEYPDPVAERVKELVKKGILKDVIVMESFPPQIRVTGPKSIIKELQAMPRKISPSFK